MVNGHANNHGNLVRLVDGVWHLDGDVVGNLDWHGDRAGDFDDLFHRYGNRAWDGNFEGHTHRAGDLEGLLDRNAHWVGHRAFNNHLPGDAALDGVGHLDGDTHRVGDSEFNGHGHLVRHLTENFDRDLDGVAAGYLDLDGDTAWDAHFVRHLHRDLNPNRGTDFNGHWDCHLDGLANLNGDRDGNLNLNRGAHLHCDGDWHPDWSAHLNGNRDRNLDLIGLGDVHSDGHGDLNCCAYLNGDRHRDLNGCAHFNCDGDGDLDGNLVGHLVSHLAFDGNGNLNGNLNGNFVRLRNSHRYANWASDNLLPGDRDGKGRSWDDIDRRLHDCAIAAVELAAEADWVAVDSASAVAQAQAVTIGAKAAIDAANAADNRGSDNSLRGEHGTAVDAVEGQVTVGVDAHTGSERGGSRVRGASEFRTPVHAVVNETSAVDKVGTSIPVGII